MGGRTSRQARSLLPIPYGLGLLVARWVGLPHRLLPRTIINLSTSPALEYGVSGRSCGTRAILYVSEILRSAKSHSRATGTEAGSYGQYVLYIWWLLHERRRSVTSGFDRTASCPSLPRD